MGNEERRRRAIGAGVAVHLAAYLAVNAGIIAMWAVATGTKLAELPDLLADPARAYAEDFWPIYVVYGWGIGLAIHLAAFVICLPRRLRRRARRRPDHDHHDHHGPTAPHLPHLPHLPLGNGTGPGLPIDLRSHRTPNPQARPWVAVVFTDIVDSTAHNHRMGDRAWADLLAEHRVAVRAGVARHHGVEVGTQGDGFLLRFDVPDDAAACAIDLQRAAHAEGHFQLRIGINAGEVVQDDDDDLIGRVINLAARVTATAAAGEILVTEPVADHLDRHQPLVDRGLHTLKGFDRPRHLLALDWSPAGEPARPGA